MGQQRGRPRDTDARARLVRTATDLFVRQGYVATTVGEIAAGAEVSVQTLYSAYGSKVGVLAAAHDLALAGDDEPVALADRDWFRQLRASPSAPDAWRSALDRMHVSTARVAPLYSVMLAAEADPDVARLMRSLRSQRHEFSRLLADAVLARPGAGGVDHDRLTAIIYATESVECYLLFVTQSGWTLDQWRDWVHATVRDELTGRR